MKVLVLRPQPGASETAAQLAEMGHEALLLPLSEIRPLLVDIDAAAQGPDLVAATSANALRHAPARLIAGLRELPFHAVGDATARAARQAGFSAVEAGTSDGQAMAAAVLARQARPRRILYLCGRVRRPDFERIMRDAGREVIACETYEAVFPGRDAEFEALLAANPGPVTALVHSPETGKALAALLRRAPGVADRLSVVAISENAAAPLRADGRHVVAAAAPNALSMLAAL